MSGVGTQHYAVTLGAPDDFAGWRDAVRPLLAARVPGSAISWGVVGEGRDLFAADAAPLPLAAGEPPRLPKAFLTLARTAILSNYSERFALLYELALGLADRRISLSDAAHPLLQRIEAMAKTVRRDIHKMRAFVRFRELTEGDGTRFVAWFEPGNHIVRANAGFFVERFANMRWSILTPALCIHWDGSTLTETPGATKAAAPRGDPVEDIWKRYYASIFNPARVKIGAMMSEMPKKYWANMPETALIPGLIAEAQTRNRAMLAAGGEQPATKHVQSQPAPPADRAEAMTALLASARTTPPAPDADRR